MVPCAEPEGRSQAKYRKTSRLSPVSPRFLLEVGHAAGGGEMVFGVEDVGAADGAGLDQVSCGVVDVVEVRVLELAGGASSGSGIVFVLHDLVS